MYKNAQIHGFSFEGVSLAFGVLRPGYYVTCFKYTEYIIVTTDDRLPT